MSSQEHRNKNKNSEPANIVNVEIEIMKRLVKLAITLKFSRYSPMLQRIAIGFILRRCSSVMILIQPVAVTNMCPSFTASAIVVTLYLERRDLSYSAPI